jgi:hypothetical protein
MRGLYRWDVRTEKARPALAQHRHEVDSVTQACRWFVAGPAWPAAPGRGE